MEREVYVMMQSRASKQADIRKECEVKEIKRGYLSPKKITVRKEYVSLFPSTCLFQLSFGFSLIIPYYSIPCFFASPCSVLRQRTQPNLISFFLSLFLSHSLFHLQVIQSSSYLSQFSQSLLLCVMGFH